MFFFRLKSAGIVRLKAEHHARSSSCSLSFAVRHYKASQTDQRPELWNQSVTTEEPSLYLESDAIPKKEIKVEKAFVCPSWQSTSESTVQTGPGFIVSKQVACLAVAPRALLASNNHGAEARISQNHKVQHAIWENFEEKIMLLPP